MKDFKTGDIVTLNSDGPYMTVEKVENDLVTCQWFRKENQSWHDMCSVTIHKAMLSSKEEQQEKQRRSSQKFSDSWT